MNDQETPSTPAPTHLRAALDAGHVFLHFLQHGRELGKRLIDRRHSVAGNGRHRQTQRAIQRELAWNLRKVRPKHLASCA